jgi:hypothetical protein
MGGSCIELTRTAPVTVAAVKIKAAQLPRTIELGVTLISHILQQAVKYLGFYSDVKLARSDALQSFMRSRAGFGSKFCCSGKNGSRIYYAEFSLSQLHLSLDPPAHVVSTHNA